MSRRRKQKPSKPRKVVMTEAEIAEKADADARIDQERRDERAEDRRVKAMPGGTVRKDGRGHTTARQIDDVVMLMSRTKDDEGRPLIGAEESGAVRMLEGMIEKANGGGGSCLSTLERVSGQPTGDPALATVIRRVDAAKDLDRVRNGMGPRTWAMLRELCDGNLSLTRWHGVVEKHSGETGAKQQGAVLRQAFRELADVVRGMRDRPANDTLAPKRKDAA